MIVTLTANPSLDRAIALDGALRPGEVQSARQTREDAAGKGINVARVVAAASAQTCAVLPLAADDPYATALAQTGLWVRTVPIVGHARSNLTITDPAGVTTKLNLDGARLDPSDLDALRGEVVDAARGARWLVLAGSLPPGAAPDYYVEVIEAVRAAYGDRAPLVAVDTSGEALAETVAHGHPDLIKPNDEELAELTGASIGEGASIEQVARVAWDLVPDRVGAALVTLGSAGALYVTAESALAAEAVRIRPLSTVGAGDSALAGFLIARAQDASPDDALRSAIRYGAAAASLPGTQAPTPADLSLSPITVQRLPR